MKEKLLDVLWEVEKLIRGLFFAGASVYFAAKAVIIIPQLPGVPDILTYPALLIAVVGGILLTQKAFSEPSRRELREAKKRADSDNKILYEMVREYEERMGK